MTPRYDGVMEDIRFRYHDVPGARLHCAVTGPEDGPLVVLLHGFPQFWYSWRGVAPLLAAAGFHVIAPDQRGYNLSTKPGPYTFATLTRDVAALIHDQGRERAHVIGHDWGGAVAWALASARPEMVDRLGVINLPHLQSFLSAGLRGNFTQLGKSYYIGVFQIPGLPEASLSANHYLGLKRALTGSSVPGTYSEQDLQRYVTAWAKPGALRAMLGWYRAMPLQIARRQLGPYTGTIAAPTLVLFGEKDIALDVRVAEEGMRFVPNGRLVRFPENTHWLPEERPADVAALMIEHFKAP